ncbi:hypothetical protein JD844_021166 [Phrynosoma platyrhinos]|uniref:Uncharacterized protein n=1 Tax=Phrynosoma platyrhinos TaxID=52577 RepID=A0ABQ7STI7_PHRPL|nr:hypothetical protein JD844_021166 [Phrynosoma platyrhinos]
MSTYEDEGDDEGAGYEDVEETTEKTAETLLPQEPPKSAQQPVTVDCCCLLWSLIWLAVLVAFAWPLSVAMAALYGFVVPLITLIGLDDISDSMLQARTNCTKLLLSSVESHMVGCVGCFCVALECGYGNPLWICGTFHCSHRPG